MRELRQFVEVANRRSISRAAEHLNISQPALSRAIQKLEESYGAPLFIRNGGGVVLSAYGLALYSRAVRVLPALDEAREEIEHLRGRAQAKLHVASGDLWGLVILPGALRRFASMHPSVSVHIDITDDGTRFEGLGNGVYDIVFGRLSEKYQSVMQVAFEPIVRQGTYIYCDREHPLAGRTAAVDELLRERWISPGYDDDAGPGKLAGHVRTFSVRVNTVMHALLVLRHSSLLMAASSGFVSLFREFGITTVNSEEPSRIQESGALYRPSALDKALVEDFVRAARDEAALLKMPTWTAGAVDDVTPK
ncbi:MAG: LysR family transcriptional regulator [Alsobacter sp.]